MENLQEKYKKFFSGCCYAFCLTKYFDPEASEAQIARNALDGWDAGYIDSDGYVAKPVDFINFIIVPEEANVRDVEKIKIKQFSELPEGDWICELKNPFGGSHFVIANNEGNCLFDPAGKSESWKQNLVISYRKYIRQR